MIDGQTSYYEFLPASKAFVYRALTENIDGNNPAPATRFSEPSGDVTIGYAPVTLGAAGIAWNFWDPTANPPYPTGGLYAGSLPGFGTFPGPFNQSSHWMQEFPPFNTVAFGGGTVVLSPIGQWLTCSTSLNWLVTEDDFSFNSEFPIFGHLGYPKASFIFSPALPFQKRNATGVPATDGVGGTESFEFIMPTARVVDFDPTPRGIDAHSSPPAVCLVSGETKQINLESEPSPLSVGLRPTAPEVSATSVPGNRVAVTSRNQLAPVRLDIGDPGPGAGQTNYETLDVLSSTLPRELTVRLVAVQIVDRKGRDVYRRRGTRAVGALPNAQVLQTYLNSLYYAQTGTKVLVEAVPGVTKVQCAYTLDSVSVIINGDCAIPFARAVAPGTHKTLFYVPGIVYPDGGVQGGMTTENAAWSLVAAIPVPGIDPLRAAGHELGHIFKLWHPWVSGGDTSLFRVPAPHSELLMGYKSGLKILRGDWAKINPWLK